jgi:hypothetical protein
MVPWFATPPGPPRVVLLHMVTGSRALALAGSTPMPRAGVTRGSWAPTRRRTSLHLHHHRCGIKPASLPP